MYEYKVFRWRFDLNDAEELEKTLNEYGKEGWRIFNIITNVKGSGGILNSSIDGSAATIILEKDCK
ncbi:protein of unknown function [Caloramator quimbayensis]|uniref:DUF4177 domain-containing protein n=1 Tax=Caloramator quimbayensis TaxID=1147123 RepID=A0A1T4WKY1_9CLOT|nr:DUF4177 domain-containing protein [Caloramator quimbayensis]SKA77993.1 protein of unknown function [Caloramator quimbayensis]